MKKVVKISDVEIQVNSNETSFFVLTQFKDQSDVIYGVVDTLRRAKNLMKKTLLLQGYKGEIKWEVVA